MTLALHALEDRLAPTAARVLAVGSAAGEPATAVLLNQDTGEQLFAVRPFGDFTGGVRTAVGDVTADGVPDLVVGAGVGGGPHVRVYDGATGQPVAGPLGGFFAFEPEFTGGVELAVGDVNGDGAADVVVGASAGGGPRVSIFSGKDGTVLQNFFAFSPDFRGGVMLACGDLDADGRDDVIAGAGAGGGPHVRAFNGATQKELFSRMVYAPEFAGGVSVACADTDGDGTAEIVTGAGPGGGPHVKVLALDGTERVGFYATTPDDTRGVRVMAGDSTGDSRAEVLATAAGGTGTELETFDAATATKVGTRELPDGGFTSCPAVVQADTVTAWNRAVLRAVRDAKLNPPVASRALAITHLAMFDAANGVTGGYRPYLTGLPVAPTGASAEVAAAAAAHRVLSSLLPAFATRWDALLAADIARAPAARAAGLAYGGAVGAAYLTARASDGSGTATGYTPGTGAGEWTPTPPALAPALLPGWGKVTPFAVASAAEFASPAPPALTSDEYAASLQEVQSLGSKTSATRTPDQTEIALFWEDSAGSVTPPGHWNVVLQGLAAHDGGSLTAHARAFALLNAALADAGITAWYTKYRDEVWRPVTAIRRAGEDGNPATTADPTWEPLIITPPFPSYTSGHSTFSGAAAAVLAAVYGERAFRTSSDALPGVSRGFASFAAAAAEAGMSRIYGGIHYQFDNTAGLASGKQVGEWTVTNLLQPL